MSTKRNVVVTGANGGIGRATVRALAERGFAVYAAVRRDDAGLAELDGVHVVGQVDVTEPDSIRAAAKQIESDTRGAGVHALVSSAGLIVQGPLELVSPEELRRQYEVTTFGPVHLAQAFLPHLRTGGGRIINVSAPTAWLPVPFLGPISSSEAALTALSDAMRLELAPWNIPVSVIYPGATRTQIFAKAETAARAGMNNVDPSLARLYEQQLAAIEKAQADQRISPPERVAKAIVRAAEARRPRRRYIAAPDVRVIRLLSRLPARVRDGMLVRAFGLRGIKAPA